jgi:hypothetical protein
MIMCSLGAAGSSLYPSMGSSRFLLFVSSHHCTLFSYAYRLNNAETSIHHFAWSNETGKCGLPRGREEELRGLWLVGEDIFEGICGVGLGWVGLGG